VNERKEISGGLFTGLLMIGIGVLFLLDEMNIADFSHTIRRYWPMIIVLVGVAKLLDRKVWGGLWLIAIGTWLQAIRLGLFGLTFSSSWPLLLIVLGVGMIARAIYDATRERHAAQ
jgi:hypothetical protein